MHINLNNLGDQFLQLSPLLSRQPGAPSPLLSPEPLFMGSSLNHDMEHFQLEQEQAELSEDLIGSPIDNLSPPIPYPSNIGMMDHSDYSSDERREDPQPVVRRRKEPRSTRMIELKAQELPPLILPSHDLPPIRAVIEFLVENSTQPERELLEKGCGLWGQGQEMDAVLASLVSKFKKLKKTKQEMTKYCMRKVFKFIADRMRKDRTHNRDVDSCMRQYFSKGQSGSPFSIPFKKNSVQKTMNGNFLKRVFASEVFVNDYKDFLREFQGLMMEDNQKKVVYLADVLEKYLQASDFKKIESIKRLPWTREILQQTEQLATSLLGYAEDKKEDFKDQ